MHASATQIVSPGVHPQKCFSNVIAWSLNLESSERLSEDSFEFQNLKLSFLWDISEQRNEREYFDAGMP